jgi:RNA polymerase sigma-70 factor (ECF subfamily)
MHIKSEMDSHEQFTRCWTQAQPMVASFLGALVPDFRDAEDLLQNVAVACLRKFDQYDAHRPFVAWALGTARLEVLHWRRGRARNRLLFDDSLLDQMAVISEELEPELDRRARALRECLRHLQGRADELVRLRYDEELKPAAIADRLRMAVVAVRVMLSRTRASLRDCIERKLRQENLQP